jgi:hypothetical protein
LKKANIAVHMSATKNCANVCIKTNRAFFAGMNPTVKEPYQVKINICTCFRVPWKGTDVKQILESMQVQAVSLL